MAILNFPKFPNDGDLFTPPGSTKTYVWRAASNAWLISTAQNTATTVQAFTIEVTSSTNSISTETGSLVVRGGVGIGGDVHVGGVIYSGGVPALTTASFNNTIGEGSDIDITTVTDPLSGLDTLYFSDISTLASVTGRGATTPEIIRLTNSTNSTATNNGALIVTGGIGVGGRVNTESIKIADTVFDSTKTTVDTVTENVIDTYLLSQFRSSKYFIQIGESYELYGTVNPRFQSVEINLTAKNDGTPYLTQYGQVTTDGELGTFSARGDVSGSDITISLTFTPIDTEPKIIKVLRTAMVS